MALVEVNWQPTARQLRQFGVIAAVALPLLAWLWTSRVEVIGACGLVGIVIAAVGLARPTMLKWLFIGLTCLTLPIGLVVSELALLLVYFGVLLPIGLCFRLVGRDALRLRRDPNAKTYWLPKQPPKDVASYFRQS